VSKSSHHIGLVAVLSLAIGCENRPIPKPAETNAALDSTQAFVTQPNSRNDQLSKALLDSALRYGDTRAYSRAASSYLMDQRGEELLYYALVLANRYNDPTACLHVHTILSNPNTRSGSTRFSNMDDRSNRLAMHYLLLAYELGSSGAAYELLEIYPDSASIPNSSSIVLAPRLTLKPPQGES